MTPPVRTFPSLLVLAALSISAFAQEQEKVLADKLKRRDRLFGNPDPDLVFDTRQGSTHSKAVTPGKAPVKEFGFSQGFRTKDFNAKTFRSKNFQAHGAWMGDMKFNAKTANTSGKYKIPGLEKEPGKKVARVKEAHDANKGAPIRAYAKGDRPYLGKEAEKMKNGIDPANQPAGWQGSELRVLSIDDIREMLNKNE